MKQNDNRAAWDAAAPGWARWEATVVEWMQPATDRMLALARVAPGAKVIDMACGAGSQTLAAARLCGPGGEVLATDISEEMLHYVRAQASAAGLSNIRMQAGPAETLDTGAQPWDAAICRLGLMLFEDPARALQALHRALRAEGRVALVVFTTPQANPMLARPMQVLLRHAGKTPAPGRPGLFALGAPGRLEELMSKAGFTEFQAERLQLVLRMRDAAHALTMMQEAFGAYRAVIADSEPHVREAAWEEVRQVLREFEGVDGFRGGSEVWVAGATRR
jgi:SAM-dependent methyltransferase